MVVFILLNKETFHIISIALSGMLTIFIAFIFTKLRRTTDIHDELKNLSPDDISPAELRSFYYSIVDSRSTMITIFDLARKDFIQIDEVESDNKKRKDFKFSNLNKDTKNILSHERYFLNWLFEIVGKDSSLTSIDIKNYRKNNIMQFNKEFNLWATEVKDNLKERGYYDSRAPKFGLILLITSIFSLILGIIALTLGSPSAILLLIISILVIIYSIILFLRFSDKGKVQYKMWKGFKKDIRVQEKFRFNGKDTKLPEDKKLLYALALGENMKSMDSLKSKKNYTHAHNQWMYWYFLTNTDGGSSFEDSIGSSFYGYSGTSSPNSVGGASGF